MTLQLRVGGTYRARNGDVVRIVGLMGDGNAFPFLGDDGASYASNGKWDNGGKFVWDLIEEISPPSPASELDAAIAKFEEAWAGAKRAMDNAQIAADDVAHLIRSARVSTNEQD